MKDKNTHMWVPMYVDKWLFGSTRLELEPGERSVFVDLMMLGAKDNGFIRANETIPYRARQLAAFLCIEEELLSSTIEKCIKYGKIDDLGNGMWRIANWDKYQLSDDYRYRLNSGKRAIPGSNPKESDMSPEISDKCPTNPGPIEDKIREDKRIEKNTLVQREFVEFWKAYPKKTGRDAALKAWEKMTPPLDKCLVVIDWQSKSEQWLKEGGQYIPLPATWINQGRWQDVPPTHKLVICQHCNHEGILPKSYIGSPGCSKCGQKVEVI